MKARVPKAPMYSDDFRTISSGLLNSDDVHNSWIYRSTPGLTRVWVHDGFHLSYITELQGILAINKGYVAVEITWTRGVLGPGGGEINEKTDDRIVDWSTSKICCVLWGGGRATSVTGPKAITLYPPPLPVYHRLLPLVRLQKGETYVSTKLAWVRQTSYSIQYFSFLIFPSH